MKRWCSVICLVFLLEGCGTGGRVPIVSPTLPEDETRERVRELPVINFEPEPKAEKAVQEKGMPEQEKAPLSETPRQERAWSEEFSTGSDNAVEALIELLEKKGIITRKELLEEIKRRKQGVR